MSQQISRRRKKECGAFFTPYWIAAELIKKHSLPARWAEGASVLDPTAGDGSLLEALIRCTLEEGIPVTESMLSRLKGYEKEADFCRGFRERIRERHGLNPHPGTLECMDFLELPPCSYDILLGNPPWLNFTDVKSGEKERLKTFFVRYGLTGKGQSLLLGASRIDLAALMIQKALQDHLVPGGRAYFFIPLSLMLNEGAHNSFRRGYLKTGDCFSFREIRDFSDVQVFPEVSTRSGFIVLKKEAARERSIPYYSLIREGEWMKQRACPVSEPGSAYMIEEAEPAPPLIRISPSSRPRQGINTGGRNSLFLFDSCIPGKKGLCTVANRSISVSLPQALIYPLLNRKQFRGDQSAGKFIFLPYCRDSGRVLSPGELEEYPAALAYLREHRESLESRKGSLLGNSIKRGLYWSLLGVGPYSFSPWKIVWEAYGRSEFRPLLFGETPMVGGEKPWIPNQALQASCSFESREEALRVLEALKQPGIERILKRQNMEGTCNWAQPGRIRRFLKEE